jgi:hypothetical protein
MKKYLHYVMVNKLSPEQRDILLNRIAQNGWRLVTAYEISDGGVMYVMEKDVF